MRSTGVASRMLTVLGLLAAIGIAGCTANSTPKPIASVLNQPISIGTTVSASPRATSSAAPTPSGVVRNMTVSTTLLSQVTAAFAAFDHIPVSDIAGTAPTPGSVYYAYDPATDSYWAMARFEPASGDPVSVAVNFQDGGNVGVFKQVGTGPWQVAPAGEPVLCGMLRFFPPAVLKVWGQPTTPPSYC